MTQYGIHLTSFDGEGEKMKKNILSMIAVCMAAILTVGCGGAGGSGGSGSVNALSYEDALEELTALSASVKATDVPATMDLDAEELTNDAALADIDTFEVTVKGDGDINIEIAAATELSSGSTSAVFTSTIFNIWFMNCSTWSSSPLMRIVILE